MCPPNYCLCLLNRIFWNKTNFGSIDSSTSNSAISTATHYLEDNAGGCLLPLDQERAVFDVLREKHPDPVNSDEGILLDDELIVPESVLYEGITVARIRKSCRMMSMKGAAGPSGLDSAA